MTITLQALQADGTWAVRNAFTDDNKLVISGQMSAKDLEAKARAVMAKWRTFDDGKQLRVHNADATPAPVSKRAAAKAKAETDARALGWMTSVELHGNGVEDYGVVHPNGSWAADWQAAVVFHGALAADAVREPRTGAGSLD